MMGGGGGMFGFGMLVWIVILGAVIWAVVQATSRNSQGIAGPRPSSGQSAKEILDARLARGEVSVEEYKKLRETLEAH